MFFSDKSAVIFSLFSPLIILIMFVLILKDTYTDSINQILSNLSITLDTKNVNGIVDAWVLAGVLASGSITVSLNSLTIMAEDKQKKKDFDFSSSPLSKKTIILSYFTSAFINTFLILFIILNISIIIMSFTSNLYLSFSFILFIYLLLMLACASAVILMMILVTFFKSQTSLNAFTGIVSALNGFLIGAYIPISEFSNTMQTIANLLPGSHMAGLLRYYLMNNVISNLSVSSSFTTAISDTFSFKLYMFGHTLEIYQMVLYVIITLLIGIVVNIFLYKKLSKRK